MKQDDKQSAVILSVIGILPVVWLALLIAPSVKGGLPEILPKLMTVFNNPFQIELCEDSLKTVLVLLLCYGFGIGIYFSTRRNYRRREEHGSAKWGDARAVNKKYCQTPKSENKLMTQNVSIGLNAKKHRRNLNTLVCGGSGAGKTRFYCKPNLMQCNSSFVIQNTLAARLEKFNLESLASLTSTDELELETLGEKKTALFALIPDNDTSFNFLVSILYTQLFQQLFYSADHIHGGSLPIPVHFLMDEFANETQL